MACWLMVDRVHWLLAQRGVAEEWRIEVAVGQAVANAHIEISAFRQRDKA